jgi:hypothetical protein
MRRPYAVTMVLTKAMYEDPNCLAQAWKDLPGQAEAEATQLGLVVVKSGSWYASVTFLRNRNDTFEVCGAEDAEFVRLSAQILVENPLTTEETTDAQNR